MLVTMNPRTRYVVYPDFVRSRHDGEMHFIDARQLMDLYGVRPDECVVDDLRGPGPRVTVAANLIPLGPREDGDYRLPSQALRPQDHGHG